MALRNSPTSYGVISIVLHWLVAVAVIGLFVSGLWMVDLGYYDDWYHRAPELHKSVGVAVLAMVLARFPWRWIGGVPDPVPGARAWETRVTHWVHRLLLLGLLATIAAGYLISTAKGDPVDVFGLFTLPATITGLPRQADVAGAAHYWLAVALISLAGVHALAALKHHFIDRDATLTRMLGWKSAATIPPTTAPLVPSEQRVPQQNRREP